MNFLSGLLSDGQDFSDQDFDFQGCDDQDFDFQDFKEGALEIVFPTCHPFSPDCTAS